MALDVFNDDDGVVDDQTGGQRDAEQGQRVDGKTKQLDEGERADERNRNGDGGDDGGAPVFKEDEDNENHENDGFAQGGNDVADRFADGVGGVERQLVLHARRKALGEAIEFGNAAAVHFERVGGGELGDANADRFASVVVEVGAVEIGRAN